MDFSSLNIEQLVAVENQERQNVEARINMLRTIHALLDAAIVQLNQYTQMINEQSQPPVTVSEPSTSAGPSGLGTAEAGPSGLGTTGAGPSGLGTAEAGPSGLGTTGAEPSGLETAGPSGSGTTEAGPSGQATNMGASTQTSLTSQPGSSSASEPADSESEAAVSAVRDNSQTDSDLNDENAEIRRRRLERFSSSDKDKTD